MNYTGYKAKKANILYLFVFILSQWLTQYTVKAACTVGLNHCMQCDSVNPNNCQRCQILYGITSSGGLSVCGPCPTGCQTCSYNVGNCTVCLSGYMHSIVTCIPCAVPGCSSCPTDINICTGCFSNYRFNAGACLVCNDVYCIYCDTNENICDYCYPGKGVNGTICIPCMDPNCQLCPQNYAQCYTCQVGLGVNSTFGCSPCTDIRCLQCSNNVNVCTRCQVGYGESGGICRNCVSGNCIACLQSTFSYCTACAIGYGPYFGSCGTCVPSFCQNCSLNRYNCRSCIYGYGLNTANNCEPCQTSISCLNCDGANSNECAVCQNNYFLDTGGLCSLCISGCQSCSNAITCNICRVGYYLDPASICLLCSRNCTDCYFDAVYGAPSCTSCEMNLGMSSQPPYQCLQNCGDFQAIDTPCDDQVGNKYDGCSDNCNVENGFLCQKVNYTSTCSYQNKIILEIVSIVQSLETNTFIMRVSVWPPLYVFRTSTLLPVFKITNPIFTITNIQFDLPTNQFIFKVDFNQTCWDCDLVLEFVPDPSIDERYFASVNSQASITVQLFYYSDFAFKISQFLPYFCYVIIVIGILAAFVGIFAKRLPGLESIIACQMAMISIIWINTYLIRPFSQLYPLQYVLGYHLNITTNHSNTSARLLVVRQNFHYSDSPYEIQFGFDQKILANNINLVLGLQAISLIFAVITSIIAECINHRIQQLKKKKDDLGIQFMKQKYTKVITVKQISLQCLMYIGMFNLVGFTAFTALFFINNSTYSYNIINLVVLSLGLLIYLCTFLLFWFTPDPFDYFRYTFKRSPFAMLYYYIYSLTLIFSVLLLELLPLTWPPLIPVGCLLIFTLAYQPYRQVKHNIRAAFNLLVILGFLSLRVIIKYNYSKSIQVNDFTFAFLLIDLILMFICVIIGLGFVVYQIIYNCFIKSKQKKNEKQEVMGQLEEMNVKKQMQNKQTIFGQLLTPKMNILEFSNMISFMNEQKINLCEQNLDNQNNQSARNLRKEMQKQKLSNNPLIKAQNLKIIQQKKQFINNLRQQMNNKQNETQLTEEQKEKNKKILYAMQIIDLQNTWIKLKHARDYTLEKIKEGVDKQFIEQYDRIL